eukprot:m.33269 g.33269  ORF g.33269 m.33269 type:complete len:680 (-) comp16786_c0_seq1:136-2175(-)
MLKLCTLFAIVGTYVAANKDVKQIKCDIVVAGGSTASLAAAITAAEADASMAVCFTDFTDWPGGQMTAGGVPAIDFGGSNENPWNQPASFRDAMDSIPGNGTPHTTTMGSGSPGACSVSSKCYLPNVLVEDWIMPRLARSPNLQVFLRTSITNTERDGSGNVVSITATQRTAKAGGPAEWSQRLSEELHDWYDPADSAAFTKQQLQFTAKVFIEATELGDVLATSGLRFAQGLEMPLENSTVYENCGQAQTLTFYMELLPEAPVPPKVVPAGASGSIPFPTTFSASDWQHTWSWRRSFCSANRSLAAVNVGDITQQNLGNDLDTAYLFPTMEAVEAEIKSGWRGGLNMTSLRMLEDRAYGWYHFLVNQSGVIEPNIKDRLILNTTTSGTIHGLSKMVYWRDTRRAIGVDGYRLTHPPLRDNVGPVGTHFYDSVALGDYNDDTHHLRMDTCIYPPYIGNGRGEGAKPYFIPFRAMMVENASNLLVAGKTMSQSFHANSNTRLHPSEWTAGVAAGGAAVLMVRNNWDSGATLLHVDELQKFLNSSAVQSPMNWTGVGPMDKTVGSVCELGRCFQVDGNAAQHAPKVYNGSTTCGGTANTSACGATLAPYEWLANAEFWEKGVNDSKTIFATQSTVLKKATTVSGSLPADMIYDVDAGAPCILISNQTFSGYWACIHHTHSN